MKERLKRWLCCKPDGYTKYILKTRGQKKLFISHSAELKLHNPDICWTNGQLVYLNQANYNEVTTHCTEVVLVLRLILFLMLFLIDAVLTVATLGFNLESNFAWILQVLTCKLDHGVALFLTKKPPTHPPPNPFSNSFTSKLMSNMETNFAWTLLVLQTNIQTQNF